MRFRAFRRFTYQVRRALLLGGDSVHCVRSGNRLSVSMGSGVEQNRRAGYCGRRHIPADSGGGLRVRVEEGGVGMGLTAIPTSAQLQDQPIGPASPVNESDMNATLEQRGFLTTTVDNL